MLKGFINILLMWKLKGLIVIKSEMWKCYCYKLLIYIALTAKELLNCGFFFFFFLPFVTVYECNKKIAAIFESATTSIAISIIVVFFWNLHNDCHKLNFEFVRVLKIMKDNLESLKMISMFSKKKYCESL